MVIVTDYIVLCFIVLSVLFCRFLDRNSQHSDQQNEQHSSLDIYNITLNIRTCFDPQGIIIRSQTKAVLHKTKLATFVHSIHGVKVRC